jgi:hypothetical protein
MLIDYEDAIPEGAPERREVDTPHSAIGGIRVSLHRAFIL